MHVSKGIAALSALALVLLASGMIVSQRGAIAHDGEDHGVAHPAHIHAGTCAELGDVVFPLSDVSADILVDGTPMAGEDMGSDDNAVEWSVTTVAAPLADIVSGGHAINIHESAENIGNYIACGGIGGVMMGTTDLAIGLGELNDSGSSGVASLHDNGDGTTTVTVYLTSAKHDDDMQAGSDDSSSDTAAATGAAGRRHRELRVCARDPRSQGWRHRDLDEQRLRAPHSNAEAVWQRVPVGHAANWRLVQLHIRDRRNV